MLTSPKLIDPFHVVRIACPDCRRVCPFRGPPRHPFRLRTVPGTCLAPATGLSSPRMSQAAPSRLNESAGGPAPPRTVPALWRAALAEGRTAPAYLAERDGV